MKRFIQSSIETLSIEVDSIGEIKVSSKPEYFSCNDDKYSGYVVTITTKYGKSIPVGVYEEKSVAINASKAIRCACVKDMLEPVANQYRIKVDFGTSTVIMPVSSKVENNNPF